jgi:hypothetical protein
MVMSHSEVNTDQGLNIGGKNTELVNSFVYLGSCIVDDKSELSHFQRRLIIANDAYSSLIALMTRQMECKALSCTTLMYGCKTCELSKKQRTF